MVKVHIDDFVELIKEIWSSTITQLSYSNPVLIIDQYTIKPFYIQFNIFYKDVEAEYDDYDTLMEFFDEALQVYSCSHARLASYTLDGDDETQALKEIIISYDYELND